MVLSMPYECSFDHNCVNLNGARIRTVRCLGSLAQLRDHSADPRRGLGGVGNLKPNTPFNLKPKAMKSMSFRLRRPMVLMPGGRNGLGIWIYS